MSTRWTRWDMTASEGVPPHLPDPVFPSTDGLRIDLPGRPPSWNHSYRRAGNRVILTESARTWKEAVFFITRDALNRTGWRVRGPQLGVHVWLYLDAPMDSDNSLKLTMDAVADGLRVNDSLFLPRVVGKRVGVRPERVLLYITNEGEAA